MKLDDVASAARNHLEDALVGATAAAEVDVLVTDDDRLTKRMRAKNSSVQVLTFAEFEAYLDRC